MRSVLSSTAAFSTECPSANARSSDCAASDRNSLSAAARDGWRAGLYGRLGREGWFWTTVTNVNPTAKQSRVIHYSVRPSLSPFSLARWRHGCVLTGDVRACVQDRRVLSVRELARSQGFPDWFVFVAEDGNVKTVSPGARTRTTTLTHARPRAAQMHRQIGNAVPWPVGEALGRELRKALFGQWQKQRDEAIVIESDED